MGLSYRDSTAKPLPLRTAPSRSADHKTGFILLKMSIIFCISGSDSHFVGGTFRSIFDLLKITFD